MVDLSTIALALVYEDRRHSLEALCTHLLEIVVDEIKQAHIDRIYFRVKTTDQFVKKAVLKAGRKRKYREPLREIEDQIAGRILVFFQSDLSPVTDKLRTALGGVEQERRRPASPLEFGYESDHLVFVIPPHILPLDWKGRSDTPVTFEMQVRTLFQHAWAEPQHDVGYKGHELSEQDRRELAWIAASAWGADQTLDRFWTRVASNNTTD